MRGPQQRRRYAVFALSLWVLGFEVLPNLHLAVHDHLAAHRHDGDDPAATDGLRVRVRYDRAADDGHRHADGSWHADAGDDHARDTERSSHRPGIGNLPATGHGRHSLAHRGLVLPVPAPVVVTPVPVARTVSWVEIDHDEVVRSRTAPVAVARGPPVA